MSQNQNLGNLGQNLSVNIAANTITVNAQFIVGNSSSNVVVNSSSISIGGTPINTTSFAGTSNNTLYVGSVTASNVVSNAQLQANVTMLQGQITANTTYSTTYTDTKIGTANSAIVANASAAYSNSVTYTDTKIATANTAMAANAAAAYSNAVSYTDTKIGTANSAIIANASAAYTNATVFASNATNVNTGTLAEARLPYRMNQDVRTTDTVTFGNMTLTGNLVVGSNVNVIGANNISVIDNMIYLNANNTYTNPDIGIAGNYNSGGYAHTGIFRDHNDGRWKVFDNYGPEPDANIYIQTTNSTFHLADFQANSFYGGNTSTNWFVANTSGVTSTGYANVAGSLFVGTTLSVASAININSTAVSISRTMANNNWNALNIVNIGGWSSFPDKQSIINFTDGTGTVGSLGVSYNGYGYMSFGNFYTGSGYASSGEVMRIVGNGNVGIGNTSPSHKLSVNGLSYFGANVTIDGTYVNFGASNPVLSSSGYFQMPGGLYVSGGTLYVNNRMYARGGISNDNGAYLEIGYGTSGYTYMTGNVGIGTSTPSYKLEVNGSFAATTKSFVIDHPTKSDMKLRHGSLEGPENGVYVRGRSNNIIIELPDYWTGLIEENSITVNLTPIGQFKELFVDKIEDNKVYINKDSDNLDYFYTVFAERKDVEKLVVEF